MVLRINILWYNRLTWITFLVRKNWTHTPSASGFYGRLTGLQVGREADRIQVDFEIFKILCRLTYSDCYNDYAVLLEMM